MLFVLPSEIQICQCCPLNPRTAKITLISRVRLPLFLARDSSNEAKEKMLDSIPLGRVCEPSDVANVACFLASDASEYVTGVNLEVDGGRCI
jgi:NAD(P)-dependent dehydrogenase (short-subunit alcohol dehydrogenase family)